MAIRESHIRKLDNMGIGITFDDVLLIPRYSEIVPNQADVSTSLGGISMSIPLLSSAMDTVSEKVFAAALAREGGIAILHKNLDIDGRVEHIQWVKQRESGIIYNPVTLRPGSIVEEAYRIMKDKGISGIPIIDDDGCVAGLLTRRDIEGVPREVAVSSRMTPLEELIYIKEMDDWTPSEYTEEADKLMVNSKVEKIPIMDSAHRLVGLITRADIRKVEMFPHACRDKESRLRVGVAVGVSKEEVAGVDNLIAAGADIICVDTAHGHSKGVLDAVRSIRDIKTGCGKDFVIIGGNIATYEGAKALIDAGVDIVKVGIGAGSICTTRIVSGVGVPQLTAIDECVRAVYESKKDVQLIADGGIRYSGDITKSLAAGADAVMIGSLFAGVEETPGDVIMRNGMKYKAYRGMGSLEAMREREKGGRDRYFQGDVPPEKLVPEGISGLVPWKGTLAKEVHQLVGGLKSGMGYLGAMTLPELYEHSRFIRISDAAVRESHVHGIEVIREAPNYRRES